jgi:uncharacterized membrane protein YpjA
MNRFQKYIKNTSFFLLTIFICLIIALQFHLISKSLFVVILTGKLLATIQFLGGMYLNEKGLKKGNKEFMIYVLGGMGARIFLNLVIILFLSKILKVTFNSFILVFFIFYVIFLIIELMYLAKYEDRSKLIKEND